LDTKDIEHFRQRLIEERKILLDELDWVESNYIGSSQRDSAGEVSGHATHLADMGTDSSEMEKAYLIGDTRGGLLEDISEALDKLDNSSYGLCEACGQPVPRDRLEAVPYAKLCLKCKTDEEQGRGASG
jgi:DnaK suppressor protein